MAKTEGGGVRQREGERGSEREVYPAGGESCHHPDATRRDLENAIFMQRLMAMKVRGEGEEWWQRERERRGGGAGVRLREREWRETVRGWSARWRIVWTSPEAMKVRGEGDGGWQGEREEVGGRA